jgi:hypothetical protein
MPAASTMSRKREEPEAKSAGFNPGGAERQGAVAAVPAPRLKLTAPEISTSNV